MSKCRKIRLYGMSNRMIWIHKNQFRFRKYWSTIDSLNVKTNDILKDFYDLKILQLSFYKEKVYDTVNKQSTFD